MTFSCREFRAAGGGREQTVVELLAPDNTARAEVWPGVGFNCLRWAAGGREWLYASPQWADDAVPTRSGVPILFPFPNRIRGGFFTHAGREFRLPPNDPAKKNAIHGFALRHPWPVTEAAADADSAWVTGEFRLSAARPDWRDLWPADFTLTATYRLTADALTLDYAVKSDAELPCGLGLHPYFNVPAAACRLTTGPLELWPLDENLPAGETVPAPERLDFRGGRAVADGPLDDLFRAAGVLGGHDGLRHLATVQHTGAAGSVEVWASPAFRELVLFAPPHRQAVAVEPYTCPTDAVNMPGHGWHTLPANELWSLRVRFAYRP